ncbi:Tc toxin subunit A-related protein [Nannocystis bainbridge]|uniref:Neuraminidase-like domain-containing protein n=1 Tax=Nannocystis bainbridge TaxID=2995303 RepID=A0ABT5E7W7_9BACT|nr:neuraminidase-like domain-containing protein [Nannocystis bainbridge]MDC0721962.1 neuraminidase-like domain-containing protein [Nannocystis bainbridge]
MGLKDVLRMTNAIRGKVTSSGSGYSPLTNVRVEMALDVGLEFEPRPAVGRSSGDLPPGMAMTTSTGFFAIPLADETVETLLGDRRHREVLFRVYDDQGIVIGTQTVYVSRALVRGNQSVHLTANPTYTPVTGAPMFSVSGFVTQADGIPVIGASIKVYKRKLRGEDEVGTGTSGSDGRFMIRYPGTAGGHSDFGDFTIYVEANAIDAITSDFCNPPADLTVRLVPNNARYVGKSNYDRDYAILSDLLHSITFDELKPDDVRFMQCRTELDRSVVTTMARAHALSEKYPTLSPQVFVAFAHAGIPLSTTSVTGLSATEITQAITQAVADNVVPPTLTAQIPTIITELGDARVDRVVPEDGESSTPVGAILIAAGLPEGKPRDFARAYGAHTGTAELFWQELRVRDGFDDALVDKIQFALQVGSISGGHEPLITYLDGKRTAGDFSRAADLARLSEDEWVTVLGETVGSGPVHTPDGVPGDTTTAQRENYAAAMARMLADLYPSAHLATRLPAGSVTSDIPRFLSNNPDFSFDRTHVKSFLTDANEVPEPGPEFNALREDLLKVQRVFAMSPRYGRTETAVALLSEGVTSAAQIRSMGYAAFKAQFSASLDARTLDATYQKAEKIATTAVNSWLFTRPEMHFPPLAAVPTPRSSNPEIQAKLDSRDYCACPPCESVLGPAAYFLDIMQFLYRRTPSGPGIMFWLASHRPELLFVDLSCENSDTPLPTLDLINEVLESRAHGLLGVSGSPNNDRQTAWSADDLLVYPENIHLGVYAKLADPAKACFPLNLPFDLPHAEAKAYLQAMGTSRLEIQDALEWFQDLDAHQAYRVDERLNLAPGAGNIVRFATLHDEDLETLWGFALGDATWLTKINKVETFLERTGLTFDELKELLLTRDLAGNVEIWFDTPCSLKNAKFVDSANTENNGLTWIRLEMLQSFLRLKRSLGWTIPELDATTRALSLPFISSGMDGLSSFLRLRQRFPQLPLHELLSWFGPLDRISYGEGKPSYYDQVVRPRVLHPAFITLDGSTTLGAVKDELLAVLRVDEASLDVIYTATGLTDASDLDHANLSKLYRVASIAAAVGLSVPDLVTLTKYTPNLNAVPGAFAGTPSALVRELIEVALAVKASGFAVPELDWVLRHTNAHTFHSDDISVMRVLIGLIVALQQAESAHKQSLPPDHLPLLEQIEAMLVRPLPPEQIRDAMRFIRKETNPLPTDYQAVRRALLFFLPDSSSAAEEFDTSFEEAESVEARAELLVPELKAWLRRQVLERVVVQQLSVACSLDVAETDTLLRKFDAGSALTTFTSDVFFAKDSFDSDADAPLVQERTFPRIFLSRSAVWPAAEVYRGLLKVARISTRFRLGPDLLRWLLLQTDAQVDLPNLVSLKSALVGSALYDGYAGWNWLRRAVRLRDSLLADSSVLTDILTKCFATSGFDKALALETLALSAGWDLTLLQAFEASEAITQLELKRLDPIEGFAAAFRLSARLGVHPSTLRDWAKQPIDSDKAAAIRSAARAKFDGPAWTGVARPIRDRLRVQQRDALADFIVHKQSLKSREDLFGLLLMDVDMAPCNRTTRLLFTTAAVQLFVQRALMGLVENVILSDEDAAEWAWMKRYRVWEANRKIFLYPENWVLPELRDDKTHLFKQFEEALSQTEIDEAAVERAFVRYLEGLRDISHLQPSGMFHEVEAGVLERMHIFAHSHADPSKLFYRRRENNAYWTAWEELPFQVDHQGVLPMVLNRRLMLVWPHIDVRTKQKPEIDNNATTVPKTTELPEVSLHWVERMNDAWSGVFVSDDRVLLDVYRHDVNDFTVHRSDLRLFSEFIGRDVLIWATAPSLLTDKHLTARFTHMPCRQTFRSIGKWPSKKPKTRISVENADNRWSFQHVSVHPKTINSSHGLKLQGPNGGYRPPVLKCQDKLSTVLFPAQQAFQDVTRPFIFADEDVALYIDHFDPGHSDASPDAHLLKGGGPHGLIPYFGAAGVTTEYQPPPVDTDVIDELSGGDNIITKSTWTSDDWENGYVAVPFYHPYACLFIERVRRFGVGGLLDPIVAAQIGNGSLLYQAIDRPLKDGHDYFDGVTTLETPLPTATIDFSDRGAYSVYNWEIFFHIPMLVADRLMAERRFAEAQRWLGFVFNPLRKPTALEDDKVHFWGLKPFREASENHSIDWLLQLLHYEGSDPDLKAKKADMLVQIERSRTNPFRPHDLARSRPTAYMRSVVMKYLDNLIAWGDDLFRQDTRESTQEAAQLYILALQILGRQPRKLDDEDRSDKNWSEAQESIDDFSNFLVELENEMTGISGKDSMIPHDMMAQADYQANYIDDYKFVYVNSPVSQSIVSEPPTFTPCQPMSSLNAFAAGPDDGPTNTRLYFCIPPNDKLLGYWDTVADRLFKLRNCLNIDGIRRDLSLYDPPIDPALLARAVAQGIDIGTAISNLYAPLPHYRFLPHLSIAKDFAAQVSNLGAALLQALEKRDAEALAILRSTQEVDLLKLVRGVKEQAIREAEENLEALRRSRAVAAHREQHYSSRQYMNGLETREVALSLEASNDEQAAAKHHRSAARLVALVPGVSVGFSGAWPTVSFSSGGSAFAWPQQKQGDDRATDAQAKSREAARTATQASYVRRKEEWDFQAAQAAADMLQIDAQITAAEIRKQMAELELGNHIKQAEQAAETLEFMRSKFSNAELYSWMSSEIGKVYHLAYQLALDLARRAERCYRYELAVQADTPEFVQFGHWDNRRQGLLAGERLAHDIRRMEAAFYEHNVREYELTKRISLASLDPVALIALRKTGACHFNLPSVIFDLDHATHYLRRIKLVGVSMPAVTGPYTNIGATLTYESGEIRYTADGVMEAGTGASQAVAISVNQEDTGLFEPNLRDERYLPFEGRALEDSKWRLALPEKLRQFDYETISDVILTVRYTAREGGSTTFDLVNPGLQGALDNLTREESSGNLAGQVQIFSARAEFPEAWRAFVADGANGEAILDLDLGEQRFPHPQSPLGTRTIQGVLLFARWASHEDIAPAPDSPIFEDSVLKAGNTPIGAPFSFTNFHDGEPGEGGKHNYLWQAVPNLTPPQALGAWSLTVPGWSGGHAPEDLIIVVAHKVS